MAGASPTKTFPAPLSIKAFTAAPTTTGCVQTASSGFFGYKIFGFNNTVLPLKSGGGTSSKREIIDL